MQQKSGIITASILIGLLLFQSIAPVIYAQEAPAATPQNVPPPTADQLDQLLAPVALYPDALLAQITSACTNPQEILDVTNWLAENKTLTGQALTDAAEKQGFDPAFLALTTFPTVLQMMADDIDDYASIGLAVTANQQMVSDSIQRLRTKAYAAGSLQTNQQQKVEVQQAEGQTIYVVQPANPQIVYVPQYNPTIVYVVQPTPPAVPFVTFAVGISIGVLIASNRPWGWNSWAWGWGPRGGIYYGRTPWGGVWVGGYRPPHYYYHPRPPYYVGRPGYGGNWGYRPPNYRPPYSNRPPSYRPPSHYPGNPGYKPPVNNKPYPKPYQAGGNNKPGQGNNNRPGGNNGNNGNNKPSQPSTRPQLGGNNGNKPSTTPSTPSGNKPTTPQTRPSPNLGGTRPAQPSKPATNPGQQSKPVPQPKPIQQNKPVPQPKSNPKPASRPSPQN